MATLFKPDRTYSLPQNPEIVEKNGKLHIQVKDRGKTVCYPLTEDKKHYLKPAAKWVADVRFADGSLNRVRFSPNKDAAAMMLSELLKKIENEKAGVIDRTTGHRKRPLTAHLDDWLASLKANARDAAYIAVKQSRVQAVIKGCG